MGQAKRHVVRFRQENPFCCYCGGAYSTETVDHAPPINMFWGRQRPKGLEVPACRFCNRRHALFDDFFGLLALLQGSVIGNKKERRIRNLISSAALRFPDAIREIVSTGYRTHVRINGLLRPVAKATFEGPEIHFTISYMAARLGLAMFYEDTGKVAGLGTRVWTNWRPNSQPYSSEVEARILQMTPYYRTLEQGSFSVAEQFESRFQTSASHGFGAFFFSFHRSFKAVAFLVPPGVDFEPDGESEDSRLGHLFEVTEECIQPTNCAFPKDVRLNFREPKEESR